MIPRSVRHRLLLIPLLLVLPAAADEPATPKLAPEAIAQLIDQLGARDFASRERASQRLWQAGRAAEPAIRKAAKSADLEIAQRAGKILERFRLGIYPDTPASIVALVERYCREEVKEREKTVKELLDAGGAGYAVLLRLAVLEPDPSKRDAFVQKVVPRIETDVIQLAADNRWDAAEQLLEQSITPLAPATLHNYIAFMLIRGRLDTALQRWRERIPSGDEEAAEGLALLLKAKGDLAAALTAAEQAEKPELVKTILWDRGDWKTLAKRSAEPDADGKRAPLGLRALYHRLAGESEVFEKRLAEALEESKPAPGEEAYFSARSTAGILFINDRPKEALEALRTEKLLQPVCDRLTGLMKYADAIALLRHGEKKDEPKSMEETRQKRTQSLQQDLKLARLYHQLGEKEKALAVLGDAANSVTDERDLASLFDLIQAEFELGMEEQALTHLDVYLKRHEQKEWPKVARCVARDELSPEVWLTLLRNKHDKEPPLEIVKRLRRLLSRSTTEKEFSSLADELEPNINALAQVRREHWLTGVATYCLECGWDAPAQKYLEKAVEVMDSAAALQRLADFHADRQQWKPAAELYGKAWDKDRTSALPLYWRGWCLVQLGQEAEGRRLMGLAVLLPLGNDRARFELAQAMRKRGLTKEADREFARLVQLGTAMSVSVTNAYGRLAAQAARQRDFARAADYWQKVPVAALDHDYYYEPAKGTWLIALQVRTERTLALIAGGQIDAARPEIDYCLSFLPGDADQTQRFCDELDRRGEKKLAEEVFTRSLTVHRDVCRQYPKSPGRHNNLAWLCARCRRGLDEALEHARKAVDLAPDEAGYLDTLAEVHFQRGETEKALELMKRCVEREPANRGYREQLVRFRSGDRTTEPPSAE